MWKRRHDKRDDNEEKKGDQGVTNDELTAERLSPRDDSLVGESLGMGMGVGVGERRRPSSRSRSPQSRGRSRQSTQSSSRR